MSKSAIRSSINHYEAKINEEYNFINKCEDEIFDLEICYKRIDNAESKHNNEQARRITVLKRFEGKNKTIKIARIYSEQMSNLIAGEENNRMVDCFEDAKRMIKKQILKLENDIDDAKARISNYKNKISDLRNQLAAIEAREAREREQAARAAQGLI